MKILLVVLFAVHVCALDDLKIELPIEERIYGGEDAGEHEFPTQASFTSFFFLPSCGGTILNEWFILTAAHCLSADRQSSLRVSVGSANITKGRIYSIQKFIIHEDYAKPGGIDLALVKLAEPLVLDGVTVKAAILPEQDEEPTSTIATLIGMGVTDARGSIPGVLQKMTTQLTECSLGKLFSDAKYLCITQGIHKGVCHGDSGGPMIVDGKVVGVTKGFIMPICFKTPTQAFYTKVSSYRSWIDHKMKTE
ncbi:chymotrypsin-1 [Anabrus simplex]|uniref:chymotrypsin-1 n=1 Tax=Anabrus simplex TaxID=316456 RepID=UPI0035A3C0F9